MTVHRPGRGVHLIADKQITHAHPHVQGNLVGQVQKQDEPGSFDSLASRKLVQAGIKYFLITKGEVDVAAIAGAVVGSPVFISTVDDSLVLVDTVDTVPFGRVTRLPDTFGQATGLMSVDMDLKDNLANAV